jgi:hypothetical protein
VSGPAGLAAQLQAERDRRIAAENALARASQPPGEVLRLQRDNDRLRERLRKRLDDCHCKGDQYGSPGLCEECKADERTLAEVRPSPTKSGE